MSVTTAADGINDVTTPLSDADVVSLKSGDRVPISGVVSGEMMLRYMGWTDAADRLIAGLEKTIQSQVVTYGFARMMDGAKEVKCSEFGTEVIKTMAKL